MVTKVTSHRLSAVRFFSPENTLGRTYRRLYGQTRPLVEVLNLMYRVYKQSMKVSLDVLSFRLEGLFQDRIKTSLTEFRHQMRSGNLLA